MKFHTLALFAIAALTLGACATNPERVPPKYTSAHEFVFEACGELREDLAAAKDQVSKARGEREIAVAKGHYDSIVRAGYEKRCDDAHPQQAAAPVIVIPPAPAPAPVIVNNYGSPPPAPAYYQQPTYAAPPPPPPPPVYYGGSPYAYAAPPPTFAVAMAPVGFRYSFHGGYPLWASGHHSRGGYYRR